MIGRTIAIIVALGTGSLASAGVIYLYSQGALTRFETVKETPASPAAPPQPQTASPQAAASPEPQPAPAPAPKQETAQPSPPAEPTVVPTFDVVVIEPSGEGVIAGRAAPGWQVSIKSGDTAVAAATSDEQGEWSAVLDKPLAAGEHALSLTITSPDGTRALTSQERVRVAVGDAAKATTAPPQAAAGPAPSQAPASPAASQVETSAALPAAEQKAAQAEAPDLASAEPRAVARTVSPGEETKSVPAAPKLVFKTVDYQDKGTSAGSVSITGTSDPGATIKVYSGEELIATVQADRDGSWSVVAKKTLPTGEHKFRAERIDVATGAASAKATVAIARLIPKPPEVAAAETKGTVAAAREAASDGTLRSKDVYTVQRGDTLWAIAKRYFGSGLRYPTIFQDNREIINDPNLIHPKQEVKVPPD